MSSWTRNTLEVERIQARLLTAGVTLKTNSALTAVHGDGVSLQCAYTGAESTAAADSVVLITARVPNDSLHQQLLARTDDWSDAGVRSVRTAGDADAPSTIAAAVYSGHKLARQFELAIDDPALAIRREVTELSADYP